MKGRRRIQSNSSGAQSLTNCQAATSQLKLRPTQQTFFRQAKKLLGMGYYLPEAALAGLPGA